MAVNSSKPKAPELQVSQWFNTDSPLSLNQLRGQVVVLVAFQILCPGCVAQGLPQAQEIAQTFAPQDVAVIGLHCVFEHHHAMQPQVLAAFLQQYDIRFPVGVDKAADVQAGPIPVTMQAYGLAGTPTTLVIDRQGLLQHHHFGHARDMALGAQIALLAQQPV